MKDIYGKLREEHVQLLRTVSIVPLSITCLLTYLANSLPDDIYCLLHLH